MLFDAWTCLTSVLHSLMLFNLSFNRKLLNVIVQDPAGVSVINVKERNTLGVRPCVS